MTTDKAPDFAGIAQALASKRYPSEQMPDFDGEVSYGPSWRNAYASCMEARLRSDWETIRLLRKLEHADDCWIGHPLTYGDDYALGHECTCGHTAHLSKLLEPFTP